MSLHDEQFPDEFMNRYREQLIQSEQDVLEHLEAWMQINEGLADLYTELDIGVYQRKRTGYQEGAAASLRLGVRRAQSRLPPIDT